MTAANAARTVTIPLHPDTGIPLSWTEKDPGSSLPFSVNMQAILADMGATISGTATVTGISSTGPDSDAPTLTASTVTTTDSSGIITVTLGGGTISTGAITNYFVGFSVPLSVGGPMTFGVWLPVMQLFAAPSIPNNIVTVGPRGLPGPQGDPGTGGLPGPKGDPGTSGAGSPATASVIGGVLASAAVVAQGGTPTLGAVGTHDTLAGMDTSAALVTITGGTARTLAARFADTVNIADFGLAMNGATDDSAAFAAAAGVALSNNRVLDLRPATGPILLATLSMNLANLHIIGSGVRDIGAGGNGSQWGYTGTCLWLTSTSASPFMLGAAVKFEGVNFFWPNQTEAACVANGGLPIAYPPLFAQQATVTQINRFDLIDCQVINAYDMLTATGTSNNSVLGGMTVERCLIFALRNSFTLQNVPTECFIVNNDFSHAAFGGGISAGATYNLRAWHNANGVWLKVLGDGTISSYPTTTVSGIRASKNYIYDSNIGIQLVGGCLSICDFDDCSFDGVPYQIVGTTGHAINAVRFRGGTWYGAWVSDTSASADTLAINLTSPAPSSPGSNFTFQDIEIPFTYGSFAVLSGTGYGDVSFLNIRCPVLAHGSWQTSGNYYGVQTNAGNATLRIDGCQFGTLNTGPTTTGVQINSGVQATISNCRFSGVVPIDVETTSTIVKISDNYSVNTPSSAATAIIGAGLTNVYDDGKNVWDKPTMAYSGVWDHNYRAGAQIGIAPTGSTTSAAYVGVGPGGPAALLPANVHMAVTALGNSPLSLMTAAYTHEGLRINDAASAVNYVAVTPAATGAASVITVAGGDTSAALQISARGTSTLTLGSSGSPVNIPFGGAIQQLSLLSVGTTAGGTVSSFMDSAAGSARQIVFRSGGLLRWNLATNAVAEGGGNAGSNFILGAYDDTGALLSTPITVTRSTGVVAFATSPAVPTATAGDSSTKAASTAFVTNAVVGAGGGGGTLAAAGTLLGGVFADAAFVGAGGTLGGLGAMDAATGATVVYSGGTSTVGAVFTAQAGAISAQGTSLASLGTLVAAKVAATGGTLTAGVLAGGSMTGTVANSGTLLGGSMVGNSGSFTTLTVNGTLFSGGSGGTVSNASTAAPGVVQISPSVTVGSGGTVTIGAIAQLDTISASNVSGLVASAGGTLTGGALAGGSLTGTLASSGTLLGGHADSLVIGATIPASGTFTALQAASGSLPGVDVGSSLIECIGAVTKINIQTWLGNRLPLKMFQPSSGIDQSDLSYALAAAITEANGMIAAGYGQARIEIPDGLTNIKGGYNSGAPMPEITQPCTVAGSGRGTSAIYILPSVNVGAGLFTCVGNQNWSSELVPTSTLLTPHTWLTFKDFALLGSPSTTVIQDGICLTSYWRFFALDDLHFDNLIGRPIIAGMIPSGYGSGSSYNITAAGFHEGRFRYIRTHLCGTGVLTGSGVVGETILVGCTNEQTDELRFDHIDLYGCYGSALKLRSIGSGGNISSVRGSAVRAEGREVTSGGGTGYWIGDLVTLGVSSDVGGIASMRFAECLLLNGYAGYSHLVTNVSSTYVSGVISTGGAGTGVTVQSGQLTEIDLSGWGSGSGTNVVISGGKEVTINRHGNSISVNNSGAPNAIITWVGEPGGAPGTNAVVAPGNVVQMGVTGAAGGTPAFQLSLTAQASGNTIWTFSTSTSGVSVGMTVGLPGANQQPSATVVTAVNPGAKQITVSGTTPSVTSFPQTISFYNNAGNVPSEIIYDDGGSPLWVSRTVNRATGVQTFGATPQFPTATAGDNSTSGATTAFVANAISGAAGVTSVAGRTGVVTLTTADIGNIGTLAATAGTIGPSVTGTTGAAGAGGTSLSTQQYVENAITSSVGVPGGWQANRWYAVPNGVTFAGAAVSAALRPYATPIYIPNAVTVKKLAVNVTTADGTTARNARVLVFADNSGAPGTAVVDSGSITLPVSTTGAQIATLGTPVNLARGDYWVVVVCDSTTVSLASILAASPGVIGAYLGAAAPAGVLAATNSATGIFGASLGSIGAAFTTFGTVTYAAGAATPQGAIGL